MSQFSVLLLLCFYRCRLELWVTGTGTLCVDSWAPDPLLCLWLLFICWRPVRGWTRCWCLASNYRRDIWLLSHDTADNLRPLPFFCVYGTTKHGGWLMVGEERVCACVKWLCVLSAMMCACLCGVVWVHLSLLPGPSDWHCISHLLIIERACSLILLP